MVNKTDCTGMKSLESTCCWLLDTSGADARLRLQLLGHGNRTGWQWRTAGSLTTRNWSTTNT